MAIAYVSERATQTATQTSPHTFSPASNCTVGNTLFLILVGASSTISTVTDNAGGNTWAKSVYPAAQATIGMSIAFCTLSTAILTSNTITVTMAAGNIRAFLLEEFSGLGPTTGLEDTAPGTDAEDNGTNMGRNTAADTGQASELLLSGYGINVASRTFTKDTNCSLFTSNAIGATKEIFAQYRILTSVLASGTTTAASISGGAIDFSSVLTFFKGAAAAPVSKSGFFGLMSETWDRHDHVFVPKLWLPRREPVLV